MIRGVVKWFNEKKGFGFITMPESKEDVFVHYSAIEGTGYRNLRESECVEFDVETHEGKLRAKNVTRI